MAVDRTYAMFDQLYELKVENFDLGAAVLSTLNSVLDDPEPDPSAHSDLTWATLAAAFAAYAALDGTWKKVPVTSFTCLTVGWPISGQRCASAKSTSALSDTRARRRS